MLYLIKQLKKEEVMRQVFGTVEGEEEMDNLNKEEWIKKVKIIVDLDETTEDLALYSFATERLKHEMINIVRAMKKIKRILK